MPMFSDSEPLKATTPEVKETLPTSPAYQRDEKPIEASVDIPGEPWRVTYYSQLLGIDASPSMLDSGLDPSLQQYVQVKDYQLSVTDDLSFETNEQDQLSALSGGANIYPGTVIPTVGDMFVGMIEPGRYGLFTLTATRRANYLNQSMFIVSYRLFDELSEELASNLVDKTTLKQYFDEQRRVEGKDPIITTTEANQSIFYRRTLTEVVDDLYLRYYDPLYETFIFRDTLGAVLDPWAVAHFSSVVGRDLRGDNPGLREYTVPDAENPERMPTPWRALARRSWDYMKRVPRNYPVQPTGAYTTAAGSSKFYSTAYSGLGGIIAPADWFGGAVDLEAPSYIFSHAFYDANTDGMSVMETTLYGHLNGEVVTNEQINTLINSVGDHDGTAYFYHQLVLLTLLLYKLNSI